MTSVGHSLVGLSIGVLCMPGWLSRRAKAAAFASFAVFAGMKPCPASAPPNTPATLRNGRPSIESSRLPPP